MSVTPAAICGSAGLRALDHAADLRAQLEAVDPRVADVGDRVELDVVVAVDVGDQAALAVAAVDRRGVDLRLDHPVRAGVRRGLEDEVVRRRVGVARVDVAGHVVIVSLPPATAYSAGLVAHDRVPAVLSSARAVELVVVARAGRRAAAAAARPGVESVNESKAATGLPAPSLLNANRPIFAFAGSARRAADGGPAGAVGRVRAGDVRPVGRQRGASSRSGSRAARFAVESAASLRGDRVDS